MPNLASRQLLRRHAAACAVSFMALTGLLLANYAAKQCRNCARKRRTRDERFERDEHRAERFEREEHRDGLFRRSAAL